MPIIGSASVQIRAVDKFFERDVRAAVRKIKNVEIELKADVDLTKVNKKLRDLRYRARNNIIQLNIDADTETIDNDLTDIVNRFHNRDVRIQANADTARAEAQLAFASRNRSSKIDANISPETQKALKGLFYTITGSIPFDTVKKGLLGLAGSFEAITIKGAAVISVVSALSSELFALTGSVFTIGSDLSDVIGLTAALPAGIFLLGTAISAAVIGWKNFGSAANGNAKALAQLPPEAQKAALSLKGLKAEISRPVQKAFWVEMGTSIQTLAKVTVPALRDGLTGTGKAMGALTSTSLASLEKFVKSGGLETMFKNSNQGLENMRQGLDPLITALGKLGTVGSKFLPQFGDWMGKLGIQFGEFIDKAGEDVISGWITDGVNSLKLLGSSISSITSLFSGISEAAQQAGFGGLSAFADGLSKAADVANREPFRSQMVNFFRAAGDAAEVLHGAVVNLFKTFGKASQVLGGFFREGSGAVAALIDNISAMFERSDMLSGLYIAISSFRTTIQQMEPGFVHLGNIIGAVGRIAAEVFKAMGPGFNDIMDTLDQVFTNLEPGLSAVIPIFNAFVQAVLSIASGPIIALADGISKLLEGFAGMPGPLQLIVMSLGAMVLLAPKLSALFTSMSTGMATARTRIAGDVEGISASAAKMYGHFGTMQTNLGSFSNALKTIPFATATSGFGGLGTSIGGAAKSLGKAAGSGLMGALSGGMALLGGPWGIAIAGGIAAIGAFGQAQEESKQRVEGFSKTLDQQTGHITNATKSLVASTALDGVTNGWDDFFRGFGKGSKSVEESLDKMKVSTKQYTDAIADPSSRAGYVKNLEDIAKAMKNGGEVTYEMARAAGTTREALKGLKSNDVRYLAEKAKGAADELSKAEEKTKALAAATGLTSASATVFAKNLETLGSATTSASDKFNALKSNLDLLSGGMNGVVNTKKGLAQALDDSKSGLDKIADGGKVALDSLYSLKDGFDFSTQAGRDLHTSLEASTDAILKNGTAAMDQALKAGKGVTEANSIAIQAMQPGIAALRKQLSDLGIAQPKIDDIIRSFGLMPDQITSAVTVSGTEEAQRKIFLTKLAADSFANGNYRAVLAALPEDAKKAIADATGTAKAWATGDYDAILKALDATGPGKEAALAQLLSVTNGNYTPAIKALNLTSAGVGEAKTAIQSVDGKTVTIAVTDAATGTIQSIIRTINGIERKVHVTVDTVYNNYAGRAGNAVDANGANGGLLRSVTNNSSLFRGNLPLQAFANGGFEKHTAQIAKAGAMRLWAEPETGGEAYIPLAKSKRTRSLKILEEVARIFGFGLHNLQMANGGVKDNSNSNSDSASISSIANAGPNVTLNVYPSQGLSEEQIGQAALTELYWQINNH